MQIGKEKIARYYKLKLWSKDQLKEAVACGEITEAEYQEIVGEAYVPLPAEPTQADEIQQTQMIIMEAMADQYEQHQADRLNDMDVQATIYEEILALKEASGAV